MCTYTYLLAIVNVSYSYIYTYHLIPRNIKFFKYHSSAGSVGAGVGRI